MARLTIPIGFCQCGCGSRTKISTRNSTRDGLVKGEPLRYAHGHGHRCDGPDFREEPNGCWVWLKTMNAHGYGTFEGRAASVRRGWGIAHRWYYELRYGPIPAGLEIDHLCRNRACVNPEHLEAVEAKENVRRGSLAKLTKNQVEEIRSLPRLYGQRSRLAKKFGVSKSAISLAFNEKTWA